jgi:hypothetical protein
MTEDPGIVQQTPLTEQTQITEQSDLIENENTRQKQVRRCEQCDRETDEWIQFLNPDDTAHYICWTCQQRDDKHFNVKASWKRQTKNWPAKAEGSGSTEK